MELRPSKFGLFYGCSTYPKCKAAHGAHPDGRPLGIPADKPTKDARIKAHEAFDQLWKSGRMRRGDAYRWLQTVLGLDKDSAHIGRFTIEQCNQLIEAVQKELAGEF